jgi:hypothetical protein
MIYNASDNQTIIRLERNKKYYVNVQAYVWGGSQYFHYPYSPIEIIIETRYDSSFFIFVLVIVIILLGLIAYFLYRKYAATKSRLDYEMQDVRNMASITQTNTQIEELEKQRKHDKYATLTDESNNSKN